MSQSYIFTNNVEAHNFIDKETTLMNVCRKIRYEIIVLRPWMYIFFFIRLAMAIEINKKNILFGVLPFKMKFSNKKFNKQ